MSKFMGSKYREVELTRKAPNGLPDKAEFYFDLTNAARYLKAYVKYLESRTAGKA
jgi:hypothetical protein